MLELFWPLTGLIKIGLDKPTIDNAVFWLHYKATVILLMTFSLIVTSRQYIGDPIDCFVEDIPLHVMDTYCWIHSTFTIPNLVAGSIGKDVIHPGVGSYVEGEDDVKYYKYYQWVCFVLFFQAVLFYVPRYIWKNWEGGRMSMLVMNLNHLIDTEESIDRHKETLLEYFKANFHNHNFYAIKFILCEVLNFANVIAQIYFMDFFLDGEFSTYGYDVFKFIMEIDKEERKDPMSKVFPKVTKCTFQKYGPSGTIQKFDGLCILSINNVNEMIYVFLWFWLGFLTFITALFLIYRTIFLLVPKLRVYMIKYRITQKNHNEFESIEKKCKIGDWFVLCQLSKNIDPLIFKEFISDLAEALNGIENVQSI